MSTRVESQNYGYGSSGSGSSGYGSSGSGSTTANVADAAVDLMFRWPMRMTGATMDMMAQGVQRMVGGSQPNDSRSSGTSGYSSSTTYDSSSSSSTGNTGSGSSWRSMFTGGQSGGIMTDTDLTGDDLKYVLWSIIFTKPGYECVLEPQHEDLVAYSADGSTYAAVKIAKFLDKARHGHAPKPEAWEDNDYPGESAKSKSGSRRGESTTVISTPSSTTVQATSSGSEERKSSGGHDHDNKGWRIPPEDQKFIVFLYKVDRRLPKQEDVTRVERVTVERNTRVV